jgi:hypothetical protein
MVTSGRVLDLIEAIELSTEKFNFPLSRPQKLLIARLSYAANKREHISDKEWDMLCDLFNFVEGRNKDFDDESFNSSKAVVLYAFLPALILIAGLILFGIYLLWGAIK